MNRIGLRPFVFLPSTAEHVTVDHGADGAGFDTGTQPHARVLSSHRAEKGRVGP
jgi:hypothetical protein